MLAASFYLACAIFDTISFSHEIVSPNCFTDSRLLFLKEYHSHLYSTHNFSYSIISNAQLFVVTQPFSQPFFPQNTALCHTRDFSTQCPCVFVSPLLPLCFDLVWADAEINWALPTDESGVKPRKSSKKIIIWFVFLNDFFCRLEIGKTFSISYNPEVFSKQFLDPLQFFWCKWKWKSIWQK